MKTNLILITFYLVVGSLKSEKLTYNGFKVFRASIENKDHLENFNTMVRNNNLNILSQRKYVNSSQNMDILCGPEQCTEMSLELEKNSIVHKEIINDLQKRIEEENPADEDIEWEGKGAHKLSWTRYHQYKDIESYLDYLASSFDMCSVEVIGKSTEGRGIKVLKVSKDKTEKPGIWIDAGLHAREWIAPATATYILLQLIEFQENHEHLLDKYNWYILPVANPDGYEYSHTKDRLWRKSRHQTPRCRGVDLNRNFGFQWTSSKGCREDYSGTEAFSEPETKAIRDYILSNKNIKAYLSLHSYSQMWLLPWGYTTEKPKDYYEMYLPAEQAVEAIKSVRGTDYLLGTPSELIYTSTGASDDWAKGVAGIDYSYTIELPDTGDYGFILPASQIEPVGKEIWVGLKAFAAALKI